MHFLCAASPTKYSNVNAYRVRHRNFIESIKKNLNLHVQTLEEHDDYFFVVVDAKDHAPLSLYYLKRQNINVISPDNIELAKEFADLLVKYDFRVENMPPNDGGG